MSFEPAAVSPLAGARLNAAFAAAAAASAAAGERHVRAVHLMFDAGRSINPAVDLGQVSQQQQRAGSSISSREQHWEMHIMLVMVAPPAQQPHCSSRCQSNSIDCTCLGLPDATLSELCKVACLPAICLLPGSG
jgi:hypothetical protein